MLENKIKMWLGIELDIHVCTSKDDLFRNSTAEMFDNYIMLEL